MTPEEERLLRQGNQALQERAQLQQEKIDLQQALLEQQDTLLKQQAVLIEGLQKQVDLRKQAGASAARAPEER